MVDRHSSNQRSVCTSSKLKPGVDELVVLQHATTNMSLVEKRVRRTVEGNCTAAARLLSLCQFEAGESKTIQCLADNQHKATSDHITRTNVVKPQGGAALSNADMAAGLWVSLMRGDGRVGFGFTYILRLRVNNITNHLDESHVFHRGMLHNWEALIVKPV